MSKLFIMNPPDGRHSYDLNCDMIQLGRAPNNDIKINDKSVSRNHLKIIKKEKQQYNKYRVNNRRLYYVEVDTMPPT